MQANDEGDGFAIVRVDVSDGGVWMEAIGTAEDVACPSCGARSWQVHGCYRRRPMDLPWRRWRVRLRLTVRRFCCPNPGCARRTFAEPFGASLPRYARRTAEVTAVLTTFAQTAGGEAGARLAYAARVPISPDTLLRLLRQAAPTVVPTPRVLGVDDLALRRRHRYATLLIDLETHRPVDLLDDRTATVLATWLRAHPGVEIIARDRAEAYAEGARSGAPDALQVADRFHLLQNAGAAMEEVLRSRRRRIEYVDEIAPVAPPALSGVVETAAVAAAARPVSRTQQRLAAARAARRARWEDVRQRRAEGQSILGIARDLAMGRKTVRRLLATPDPPRNRVLHPPPERPDALSSPSLQPYLVYLQDRWQAGVRNMTQLYREIAAQGFTRSRSLVAQALLAWRPALPPGPRRRGRRRTPHTRRVNVRWLCLRPPDQLDATERAALDRVFTEDPTVKTGYDLLQRFRAVLGDRDVTALGAWLADAHASELAPFVSMANGIGGDRAAVEAALTTPWSTGPVEGHVHRVKLLKRQHYGRAKLDLLRARVLAA